MCIRHYVNINRQLDLIQHNYAVEPGLADEVLAWLREANTRRAEWMVRRSISNVDIGIAIVREYSNNDAEDRELALHQIGEFENEWRHRPGIDWVDLGE